MSREALRPWVRPQLLSGRWAEGPQGRRGGTGRGTRGLDGESREGVERKGEAGRKSELSLPSAEKSMVWSVATRGGSGVQLDGQPSWRGQCRGCVWEEDLCPSREQRCGLVRRSVTSRGKSVGLEPLVARSHSDLGFVGSGRPSGTHAFAYLFCMHWC